MAQVRLRSRQASDAASVRNRSSNLAALRALSQRLLPSANLPNGSTEVNVGVSKPRHFHGVEGPARTLGRFPGDPPDDCRRRDHPTCPRG